MKKKPQSEAEWLANRMCVKHLVSGGMLTTVKERYFKAEAKRLLSALKRRGWKKTKKGRK